MYYGEARDAESVYGVIEAAQTGHEVLTTTTASVEFPQDR
ncbi:hypothetical protein MJL27_27690 [Salmonella enterica subsp. enterica serovar Anatum]|nr:hypothetical protein [Salmonella enterica subsp. enterica serovar Anatum]